jgi:hypothetical protein
MRRQFTGACFQAGLDGEVALIGGKTLTCVLNCAMPTAKHDNRATRKTPPSGAAGWWYIVGAFWTIVVIVTAMNWILT